MDWNTADDECYKHNAHLASIHSDAATEFVGELLDQKEDNQVWIGAQREGKKFKWKDESVFDYENWNVGEPNHRDRMENCVELYSFKLLWKTTPLKWNDVACSDKNKYLCMKTK